MRLDGWVAGSRNVGGLISVLDSPLPGSVWLFESLSPFFFTGVSVFQSNFWVNQKGHSKDQPANQRPEKSPARPPPYSPRSAAANAPSRALRRPVSMHSHFWLHHPSMWMDFLNCRRIYAKEIAIHANLDGVFAKERCPCSSSL